MNIPEKGGLALKKSFIKMVSVLTAGTLALGGVPVMAEDNKTADLSAVFLSPLDTKLTPCDNIDKPKGRDIL